jgi:hypothetical protein
MSLKLDPLGLRSLKRFLAGRKKEMIEAASP